jgi:hypothetical protein
MAGRHVLAAAVRPQAAELLARFAVWSVEVQLGALVRNLLCAFPVVAPLFRPSFGTAVLGAFLIFPLMFDLGLLGVKNRPRIAR